MYGTDCLSLATIDGKEDPHFFTIFTNLLDFFTSEERDFLITLYWVMFAVSLFGLLGDPINLIIGLYVLIFIIERSISEYSEYVHLYGDEPDNKVYWWMFWFNFWNLVMVSVMVWPDFVIPFGAIINLIVAIIASFYYDMES